MGDTALTTLGKQFQAFYGLVKSLWRVTQFLATIPDSDNSPEAVKARAKRERLKAAIPEFIEKRKQKWEEMYGRAAANRHKATLKARAVEYRTYGDFLSEFDV